MDTFAVGTLVRWESKRVHVGRIIGIVEAGQKFYEAVVTNSIDQSSYETNKGSCGKPRDHRSYIVEVQQRAGSKPRLHWPLVPLLRLAPIGDRGE